MCEAVQRVVQWVVEVCGCVSEPESGSRRCVGVCEPESESWRCVGV